MLCDKVQLICSLFCWNFLSSLITVAPKWVWSTKKVKLIKFLKFNCIPITQFVQLVQMQWVRKNRTSALQWRKRLLYLNLHLYLRMNGIYLSLFLFSRLEHSFLFYRLRLWAALCPNRPKVSPLTLCILICVRTQVQCIWKICVIEHFLLWGLWVALCQ